SRDGSNCTSAIIRVTRCGSPARSTRCIQRTRRSPASTRCSTNWKLVQNRRAGGAQRSPRSKKEIHHRDTEDTETRVVIVRSEARKQSPFGRAQLAGDCFAPLATTVEKSSVSLW